VRARTVGTRLHATTSGVVTALRFYTAGRPGARVRMTLWSAAGKRLATVRFGRGAPAGWKAGTLRRPVRLHSGRTYVVTYTVPRHRVSRRSGTFARGRVVHHGALVASGSRTGPGRGFPTRRSRAAFFADVRFRPEVFPTPQTAGVPVGWRPRRTVSGTYTVRTPGAVVQDLRVDGSIEVAAKNVTLRRVEVVGGSIGNWGGPTCTTGLRMEQVSVVAAPGQDTAGLGAAISTGGYTADRVKIDGLPEGFRVGGRPQGCGPVTVTSSYVRIVAPTSCAGDDWHGDGIQGWQGDRLTVRNSVFVLQDRPDCTGTAPFFYPGGQGNASVDVDGLVVQGGGFSFRLGTPGSVRNLNVVAGSYRFGPLDVDCGLLSAWDARLVRLAGGQPVGLRRLTC
jgi:hypothetical protein